MRDEGRTHVDTLLAFVRRGADVLLSAALVLVTAPVLLIALVGSAVVLRSWPFFSQERIGRRGLPFRLVKVRTLPPGTPAYTDKFQLQLQRVPAFCRVLRRLHLDELPQLYLVLAGRMSLVGPRPEMRYLHEKMSPAFAVERTTVRPGCTGLWQISDACVGLISSTPQYDRFYLANRSLRLDAWILARTALKMTNLSRHVTLDEVPSWVPRGGEASLSAEGRNDPVAVPATAGR